ncbi:unnamed protein product [Heligmosomoides polygyrus]|uniref:HTH_48 domain-containing protein n=1 Tax=Heligmosomoides polygyrus TaxID=6339 RepID=A0A183FH66_HELPZ|nr:unnamed protein product [Heligmosomoides polygyrus]
MSRILLGHVLLYEFESGHSATEAYRNLCRVFGSEAASARSVYCWFERFRSGNRSLEDEPRSGRLITISLDELRKLAGQHPCESVCYFVAALDCSRSIVDNGLQSLGMDKKLGQWLPHELTDDNRRRRLDICTQLLS